MDRHEIAGYEVVDGTVKPTGNGAHGLVPRRWLDATVKVVRISEPAPADDETTNETVPDE
jgi:putative transposon-encoded protein